MDWRSELPSDRPFLYWTGTIVSAIGITIATLGMQIALTPSFGCFGNPGGGFGMVGMAVLGVGRLIRSSPLGWRWWIAFPLTFVAAVFTPDRSNGLPMDAIVSAPSLGRSFRDLADAQERAYDLRGEYTRERADLRPVVLPWDARLTVLSATTQGYEMQVDSGVPVARSCIIRGSAPKHAGRREFFVDCRDPVIMLGPGVPDRGR